MANGALVFAGGGLSGIAWEIGVLVGIKEAAPDTYAKLMDAGTTFVGTSAGSAVASQIAGGTPLEELYAGQLAEESAELGADIDLEQFMAMMGGAIQGATSPEDARRRIGAMALAAGAVDADARMAAIDSRLPVKSWPSRTLLLAAVDTATGELRVFDRDSRVDLVAAVAASCAVPGIWPTVEIDGRHYMDGGTRTNANADLAAGADPVLILNPGLAETPMGPAVPQNELDALAPARILAVYADDASIAAFGSNPLDPAVRPPAARAGRDLGLSLAAQVTEFWN